jgi:hypothetical protein
MVIALHLEAGGGVATQEAIFIKFNNSRLNYSVRFYVTGFLIKLKTDLNLNIYYFFQFDLNSAIIS